jgi:hypothetical protein
MACYIKKGYETRLKIDGRHGMLLLAQCKLEDYPSITEWSSAQKKLIDDLQTCGITVDKPWRVHYYILENLPKSTEWTNFKQMLTMTGKTESTTELLSHLLTFEAQLKREKGLPSDSALFVTRRQREKATSSTTSKITCFGCGVKGHKKEDYYRQDKLEAHKAKWEARKADRRGEDSVNTVAITGEPSNSKVTHLFAMYPVLTGSTSPTLDTSSWTVDTGATSHVTGERSSITSDYTAYAPGEHQVKMANGTVVDAAGIGTAVIQTGETTIVLQQVLYVR